VAQAVRPAFLLFSHVVNDILLPLVLAFNTKLVARPTSVGGASGAASGGTGGAGGGDGDGDEVVVVIPPLISVTAPECAHFPLAPGCEDYYHSAEVVITFTIIIIIIVI
jgi:hypothetical protein